MKKTVKKLKLNKETLRAIDTGSLQGVAGASNGGNTCISYCNRCYTKENTFCNC
jgi:hypothetical protein